MMASGGVYTTAADMARYLQFHINRGSMGDQRLISQELLETMHTPQFAASAKENYGLGIGVYRNHDARMLAHGGGGFGFLSNMIWYPELKLGITTLTNSSSNNLVFRLEQQILDSIIALDPALYAQRASIQPPAAVLKEQGTGLLPDSVLPARIQAMAPAPTEAERADWRQYTGVYGVRHLDNITEVMVLDLPGDYLTLDGEPIYGFGSGLFFLSNGEALDLAADPPTYRNIPLQKLNTGFFWFLRGIAGLSLLFFLGAVLVLPLSGIAALMRRRRVAVQGRAAQPRRGFPGWLTGLLVWLAALLGMLLLPGIAALAVLIRGGSLPAPGRIWSQFPAFVFGHLPAYQPAMPWYVQTLVLLPYAVIALAAVAGVGMWQAWRERRWSTAGRALLTVVVVLLLVMAVLVV